MERWAAYVQRWLSLPPGEWAATVAGWVATHTHLGPGGTPTLLDDWQVYLMDNPARHQIWAKSRQVGFSWAVALQKLARALQTPGYTGVFVSVNQEEAKNKIRYAREAYESLPRALRTGRHRLTHDAATELAWANGSRLISLPAKPVRGYARVDLVLDEFAHIPKAREVYIGSTASAVRGQGINIILGSSPLGRGNMFYDIFHDTDAYRAYEGERYVVRWWDSSGLCRDVQGARERARKEGWDRLHSRADVEARVREFGTPNLISEFEGLPLQAFLREFEAVWVDEAQSLIPLWAIQGASDAAWEGGYYATMDPLRLEEAIAGVKALVFPEVDPSIGLYAGFDMALTRHQSVVALLAPREMGGRMRIVLAGLIAMRHTPTPVQVEFLSWLLSNPIVVGLWMDASGMGLPVAQALQSQWGGRVHPVPFTAPEREYMASRLALLYEEGAMYQRHDRNLVAQLLAVRRDTTPSGRMTLVADEGPDHHADMFWAIALAARGAAEGSASTDPTEGILFAPRPRYTPWGRK